jgi:hypothetical protein
LPVIALASTVVSCEPSVIATPSLAIPVMRLPAMTVPVDPSSWTPASFEALMVTPSIRLRLAFWSRMPCLALVPMVESRSTESDVPEIIVTPTPLPISSWSRSVVRSASESWMAASSFSWSVSPLTTFWVVPGFRATP